MFILLTSSQGVFPALVLMFLLVLYLSKSFTACKYENHTAKWRGVNPSLSCSLCLQPLSSKCFITFVYPYLEAACKGVWVSLPLLKLMLAPFLISTATILSSPSYAASKRGVHLNLVSTGSMKGEYLSKMLRIVGTLWGTAACKGVFSRKVPPILISAPECSRSRITDIFLNQIAQ
jgi:hypothetical protein